VRLIPRDEKFFDHFAELAAHIERAATLLHALFEQIDRRQELSAQIKQVEKDGDVVAARVNERIDTSFVTPLDREDILLLAKRLDNVIDLINGTARRVAMFHVTVSRPGGVAMADVLVRAAREIRAAVGDITRRPDMMAHARAIKALEEEGDGRYGEAITALFAGAPDPLEVIKWKEILDSLEEAVDECEDVGNVLESISLKNS
jgi:uncharacterized protein Yka (UPF0111/DUF47 family)